MRQDDYTMNQKQKQKQNQLKFGPPPEPTSSGQDLCLFYGDNWIVCVVPSARFHLSMLVLTAEY